MLIENHEAKSDREVTGITITYSDGTSKPITKGLAFYETPNEEEGFVDLNFEFLDMSGADMKKVVSAFVQFAYESGLIGQPDEEVDEDA